MSINLNDVCKGLKLFIEHITNIKRGSKKCNSKNSSPKNSEKSSIYNWE